MTDNATCPAHDGFLIYLVDDEPILLDLAELALSEDGYKMKRFENAEAALKSFASEPLKPALLLTDYCMGSMNGVELSVKCKQASPAVKIVMVSGTAGPEVIRDSPNTVDKFLAKPYRPSELARMVRTLLAEKPV